jgi:hypothetical protein
VAYLAPNCAEMLIAQYAVPLAGGVLVTLNTRLSPGEIAQIIEHSGAQFLLGDAPLLQPALENLSTVTALREIVTLPGGNRRGHPAGRYHQLSRSADRGQRRTLAVRGARRGRRDQPELHLRYHRRPEGCDLHPPRRLPQCPGRGDPPGLHRRFQLSVDAADVPLQWVVHERGR